jgi:hypothetical protein
VRRPLSDEDEEEFSVDDIAVPEVRLPAEPSPAPAQQATHRPDAALRLPQWLVAAARQRAGSVLALLSRRRASGPRRRVVGVVCRRPRQAR